MSNIVDIKITDVLTNDEDVIIKSQFITTIEKVEITVENLTIAESAVDVARDMLTKIDSMDLKD